MDKKEINSKMTVNFMVWIGGMFMLLLAALLADFVGRIFSATQRFGSQVRTDWAAPVEGRWRLSSHLGF
jgi:hypothetical protein